MSVYRVDKSEQPVVMFQSDGSVMKGVIFLSSSAYSHIGRQTLSDLLYEKEEFFPFRSETGEFSVLNKATITHVRYQQSASDEEFCQLGSPVEVLINFVGGEQLRGTILVEMREGRNRLTDFINSVKKFFAVNSGENCYLVNVAQIRNIRAC